MPNLSQSISGRSGKELKQTGAGGGDSNVIISLTDMLLVGIFGCLFG